MITGEAGSVCVPQAIAFKDKLLLETPARREDHSNIDDILSTSGATSSVSPLRSEPYSTIIEGDICHEEHILVKAIREQIQKQPVRKDPPAWTKHLSAHSGCVVEKKKNHLDNRDDGSKESNNMVVQGQLQTAVAAAKPIQSEEEQIAAIAEKARAEIAELEAQLTRQEEEAIRLAEQAAAIVAQLEAEADKKAKMAEVAILKAKLALQDVDSSVKHGSNIVQTIAQKINIAEKNTSSITEDRAEISSVPSTRDERQEHSVDTNNEVAGITANEVDIAEPPAIVRQTELPADVAAADKKEKKGLTIITNMSNDANEFVVSPLGNGSPRKRSIDDGSTMETIYRKIEECQETILNPNKSMEEQSKAAELMEKMARIAKITEGLEPKKSVLSPLSCTESLESLPKFIPSPASKQSKK